MISLTQFFGPYYGHKDVTAAVSAAAEALLDRVNELMAFAAIDGVEVATNPVTGSQVSGERNGGFRPQDCPIGALQSKHKTGHGVDLYDPKATFAAWCYANPARLEALGLTMENHRWTPTWCHLQDVPPGPPGSPWRLDFVPSNDPPMCLALAEQVRRPIA